MPLKTKPFDPARYLNSNADRFWFLWEMAKDHSPRLLWRAVKIVIRSLRRK